MFYIFWYDVAEFRTLQTYNFVKSNQFRLVL